jgi:glyoxylase-like metal-dependent hydrolase (beta-lactamase superfamily II)
LWGLVAAPPLAPSPPAPIAAYDVVRLADGVHGFVWKNSFANPIQGNALFIINDNDDVVVDTGLLPSTARVMAAELRKLTTRPVRYVVNTHWHDDHHTGNAVYRELWPEAEFIAHRDTRADLIEKSYGARPQDLIDMQAQIERYERWAATGKDDEGKPLEEQRRTRAGEIAALDRGVLPELKAAGEMPPSLTFVDELVLQRGDRRIEVRWLGRGNTRGDTVVVLPKEQRAFDNFFVQPAVERTWRQVKGEPDT